MSVSVRIRNRFLFILKKLKQRMVGGENGAGGRNVRLDLPPFTLVGATTRAGDLSAPLRDRFGIISKLEYYTQDQLASIIQRTARVLNVDIEPEAVIEIAKRSRGTPRIANRLLRRIRDFAQVLNDGVISKEIADASLNRLHGQICCQRCSHCPD